MKLFGDRSDHSSPAIQSGHFAFTATIFSVSTSWVEVINLSLSVSRHAILKTDVGTHVGLKVLSCIDQIKETFSMSKIFMANVAIAMGGCL